MEHPLPAKKRERMLKFVPDMFHLSNENRNRTGFVKGLESTTTIIHHRHYNQQPSQPSKKPFTPHNPLDHFYNNLNVEK